MSDQPQQPTGGAADPAATEPESTLREQVVDFAHTANSALNGVSDAVGLTGRVQANPYGMVAAALGLGYVVGGGLFSGTTMRLFRLGLKLATIPAVQDKLFQVVEAAVDGLLANASGEPSAAATPPAGGPPGKPQA